MTRLALAFACSFALALAAASQMSLTERHGGRTPCVTSATCPSNKPVCVAGQCEDPNDR